VSSVEVLPSRADPGVPLAHAVFRAVADVRALPAGGYGSTGGHATLGERAGQLSGLED
jgi:hypothetical protein